MISLLLTKKAADDLKTDTYENVVPESANPKYRWLCHVFPVNRRKFYIFLNEATLFSVLLEKNSVDNIWQDFKAKTDHWMKELQVDPVKSAAYLSFYDRINIFKATDKSFLGHLNNIVFHAQHEIDDVVFNKILSIDFAEIRINNLPQAKLGYTLPHEAFKSMVNE